MCLLNLLLMSGAFYIVSGIVFIAFIYRGLHAWLSENFTFTAALVPIIIGAGISIICGFWAGILAKTPLVYESHYKVTINESVSMNEFLDNYEILDWEDKIYTVRKRTQEETNNER